MSTQLQIYQGPWVDRATGSTYGATITLKTIDGAVLLAALSFFTTVAGSSLWRLVRFSAHQVRTRSAKSRDGLCHAHNIMLRNSGSTEKALWDALRIGFAWRKSAASSLFRSLTLASLALVVLCVVAASSVLSAKAVLSHSTLGLIFSSNYGPLVFFTDHNYGDIPYVIMATKTTEEVNTATEYVNSCYRSVSGSQCNSSYVVQRLPYKVTTGAGCSTPEPILDTTGDAARLFYRRLTSCSPLQARGYTAFLKDNAHSKLDYWAASYGRRGPFDPMEVTNETFRVYGTTFYTTFPWLFDGYNLLSSIHCENDTKMPTKNWIPLPGFLTQSGDVTLLILGQVGVYYVQRSFDPFFSAYFFSHGEVSENGIWQSGYTSTNPNSGVPANGTAMACRDQDQLCASADPSSCSALAGPSQSNVNLGSLSSDQLRTAMRIRQSSYALLPSVGAMVLGSHSLLASRTLLGNQLQHSPPDNQWILEVEKIFQLGLAQLQRQMIEYVGGYVNAEDATQWGQMDDLCQQQIVPLPVGFQNFSILGIAILITVGGLIIILGYSIDGIVGWIQNHSAQASHARLSWQLETSLQLQRMAQENAGWGTPWAGQFVTVPTTNGRAMLEAYHSS